METRVTGSGRDGPGDLHPRPRPGSHRPRLAASCACSGPAAWRGAAAALLCAGCGDSGDGRETFDNGEFDITFEYPDELREAKDVTFSHSLGAKEQAKASVGIDKQNAILVT
ncbi:MAG: hypothetical protein ACREXY_19805, partial [Gammaproteobacteria bacterium]